MQLATITLLLAGDPGNTVQKFDITPSEIAVLRFLHSDDAVIDIEPSGDVKRTSRAERTRLLERYGRNLPNGQFASPALDALFPGVAARMYETFDELELDDSFFKAETRVSNKTPVEASGEQPAPAEAKDDAEEDDGIGEMDDNLFK